LRRELLRLFELGDASASPGAGVFPPVNVTQDDNSFFVRAEIPGVSAEELSISVVRNRVSLAGNRKIKSEQEHASYHRKERPEGSFNRTLVLPVEVDAQRVDARYADGVLTLTLPKAEAARSRQITVKT
jgi:HSP20 family protein